MLPVPELGQRPWGSRCLLATCPCLPQGAAALIGGPGTLASGGPTPAAPRGLCQQQRRRGHGGGRGKSLGDASGDTRGGGWGCGGIGVWGADGRTPGGQVWRGVGSRGQSARGQGAEGVHWVVLGCVGCLSSGEHGRGELEGRHGGAWGASPWGVVGGGSEPRAPFTPTSHPVPPTDTSSARV